MRLYHISITLSSYLRCQHFFIYFCVNDEVISAGVGPLPFQWKTEVRSCKCRSVLFRLNRLDTTMVNCCGQSYRFKKNWPGQGLTCLWLPVTILTMKSGLYMVIRNVNSFFSPELQFGDTLKDLNLTYQDRTAIRNGRSILIKVKNGKITMVNLNAKKS